MHVAVPVSNPNAMYQAGGTLGSQGLAAATASLSESGMLSPPQASLHRNVVSGGGSQRPTSAGSAGQWITISLRFLLMVVKAVSHQIDTRVGLTNIRNIIKVLFAIV